VNVILLKETKTLIYIYIYIVVVRKGFESVLCCANGVQMCHVEGRVLCLAVIFAVLNLQAVRT
jgi:hypothetical protein